MITMHHISIILFYGDRRFNWFEGFNQERVTVTKRTNFRKSSKIFNPKIFIADFGQLKQGFLSMKLRKKNVILYSKNDGGGAALYFSENPTVLEPLPIPQGFILKMEIYQLLVQLNQHADNLNSKDANTSQKSTLQGMHAKSMSESFIVPST